MIDSRYTDNERDQVYTWLREFNHSHNGEFMKSLNEGAEKRIFLIARDSRQVVCGGLEGIILHSWVRINLIAVCPGQRNKGIGKSLVVKAEEFGQEQGCKYSYVDTMSYQAPGFYENLGYRECGRLEDWDSHGHDKIFFSKLF